MDDRPVEWIVHSWIRHAKAEMVDAMCKVQMSVLERLKVVDMDSPALVGTSRCEMKIPGDFVHSKGPTQLTSFPSGHILHLFCMAFMSTLMHHCVWQSIPLTFGIGFVHLSSKAFHVLSEASLCVSDRHFFARLAAVDVAFVLWEEGVFCTVAASTCLVGDVDVSVSDEFAIDDVVALLFSDGAACAWIEATSVHFVILRNGVVGGDATSDRDTRSNLSSPLMSIASRLIQEHGIIGKEMSN